MSGTTVPTNVVATPGIGVIGAGQLNTYVQTDVTASQLRGFIGVSGMTIVLQGIASANDGLGGIFYWDAGTGFVDDNLDTIVPPAAGSGAWLRLATGSTAVAGVTSVALTAPSILTVAGSPITSSGTIALTLATEAANLALMGPTTGAATTPTFRAIVPADLPVSTTSALGAVKPDGTSITITAGVISAVAGGTGTVTHVGMTVPSILSVSGSPITTTGTLAVSLANESANLVFAGPASGGATTPSFRSLVTLDMPASVALLSSPTFTGTPEAPTASSTTSTTQIATTAFANPGSSLTANGSYNLPGGLIVNWNFPTTNGSGLYTWTFHTAFTTSVFFLGATVNSSVASNYSASIAGISNTQAAVVTTNLGTGATSAVFVLAIGY